MSLYSYRYETTIGFSSDALAHAWLLRCLPRREQFQRVIKADFSVSAYDRDGCSIPVTCQRSTDGFGSPLVYGEIPFPHQRISIVSSGIVALQPYRICDSLHGMYRMQTRSTAASPAMDALTKQSIDRSFSSAATGSSMLDSVRRIAQAIHEHMTYSPGSTTVRTSASEAFATGLGVCQDYTHILIGMLRSCGIPARYVCGFLNGEGATHAWAEFFMNGAWLPIDPTNGQEHCRGYIKIAHGRDGTDCAVNRGVFIGGNGQYLEVSTKVFEISDEQSVRHSLLALRHSSPACSGGLSKDHQ